MKDKNLKYLQSLLEETRLSFGDENILEEKLGIKTGAVSIFNIVNLKENDLIFILDDEILKHEKVAFHPNVNTETVIFIKLLWKMRLILSKKKQMKLLYLMMKMELQYS